MLAVDIEYKYLYYNMNVFFKPAPQGSTETLQLTYI